MYWDSPEPVSYTYNGTSQSGTVGNYWGSAYSGTDDNKDGIGDTPYTVPSGFGSDTAPLIGIWKDGTIYGGPDTVAPIAGFMASTTSGQASLSVTFTSWTSGPGTVSTYAWDFGDGTTSTDANPSHTYNSGGTYTVNLTVTGPGGSTSTIKTDLITAKVQGVDLTVSSVSTLYPRYNTVTATIRNQGTVDSGAFKGNFTVDGNTTGFNVASLAGGSTTTISVTDTVFRKYNQKIPINVTVDTENTVAESDETNNVYNATATVAIGADYYYGGRYYTGNDLETSVYREGHIGVAYTTAGIGYGGAGTVTYTPTDPPVPATAKILSARLYQSWTWYGYGSGDTVQFNGHEKQGPEALYFEGIDGKNGQAVFNITDFFVPGSDNTAVITATSSANYAPLLIVVYEDESEPYRKIWVDEGSDTIYSDDIQTTDPYIAYAEFGNVATTDISSAKMTAFLPSGSDRNVTAVIFNGQLVPVKSTGGTDPTFKYVEVTDALQAGTNELGIRMFERHDYLNIAAAILEVTTKAPPAVAFTANATSGQVPLTVQFTDLSYGATSWQWDFNNDGTVDSTEQNPVHTYQSAGTYSVRLVATNAYGSSTLQRTDYISVASSISFTADSTFGSMPMTVQFTDTSIGATGWQWDFNNDGTVDSTEQNPVHTYQSAGTYSVNLTVISADGGSGHLLKSNYITVIDPTKTKPYVSFSSDATSGRIPLTVRFTDTTVGSPTAWNWTFGDSGTSTEQNPVHTYLSEGSYDVSLSATGPGGINSTTVTNAITVSAPLTANSYNGGIPLTTVQNGTVTGGLWYDAYPGFDTNVQKKFTLPHYTSIKWARLYVDVYDGYMTNNYRGTATINIDANGDNTYEIKKTETFNTAYSFPGTGGTGPVWLSDHMNRVTSDYLMWYDLTGAISGNVVNVQAATAQIDTSFDGRIKAMVLIVAYDNGNINQVRYWVNQGHDTVNKDDALNGGYTGSTNFDMAALNGGWTSANLTAIYLASDDGIYTFHTTPLASGNRTGAYFGIDDWDVTHLLTAGQDRALNYKNGTEYFKIPLALMSVRYTGNATYNPPVAAFSAEQTSTPLTVQFTDESTNSPDHWNWSFGDGNSSTETNPHHTFPATGTYVVNLTVSNTAGNSSTEKQVTVVETITGPDLSITRVSPNGNANAYFALETNNITATIKNAGTTASGAFNVTVLVNGTPLNATVSGLAAGVQTKVTVTDPVIRAYGDPVMINVTADPDNVLNETTRANNHYNLSASVIYNGYKGKWMTGGNNVTTHKSFDINGNLVYSFGDSEYHSGSFGTGGWTQYTVNWTAANIPLPDNATVLEARLYAPYTWDNSNEVENVRIEFNGVTESRQAWYTDKSNFGTYPNYAWGLLTYDVTREFKANALNTATFSRKTPKAAISPYGLTLAVVYSDPAETRKQLFLNEEFDLLGADSTNYATTPEEATAYVPFNGPDIDTADITLANLITFIPSGNDHEGDLLFNGATIAANVWSYPTNVQVAVDTRDVKNYLHATGNVAGIRSTAGSATPSLAAAQEFLVVKYGPAAAFTQSSVSGDAPLIVQFTDQSLGSPDSWYWDFGDGSSSSEQSPSHTYTIGGTYTVKLTVSGPGGRDILIKSGLVTVNPCAIYNITFDLTGIKTQTSGDSQTITIDTANATVNDKSVNVTGVGSGWDHFMIDLLAVPTTGSSTVSGTVAGVTAVTEPMMVPLTSVGTPTVRVVLDLARLPDPPASLTTTIKQDPDAAPQSAFSLAASKNGKTIGDIAYTVNFTKTGIRNSNDGGTIQNATVYMAISPAWLTANGWTKDNMTILRYADNGTTTLLQTTYRGTDASGNYLFSGYSPDGLSVFVLAALSPKSSNDSGGGGGGGGSSSGAGGGYAVSTGKESLIFDSLLPSPQSYSWIETTTVSDKGTITLVPLTASIPGMSELKATWRVEIPTKPDGGGKIITAIVSNLSATTINTYRQALGSNGYGLGNISYSMLVTEDNIPVTKNATIEMTIPQDWVYSNGGIDQIRILRIDNVGNVQILDTAFCKYDRDSRYISFQASSPDGLCTFTLVSVTGSGKAVGAGQTPVTGTAMGSTTGSSDAASSLISGVTATTASPYFLWLVLVIAIVAGGAGLVALKRSRERKGRW